MRSIVLVASCLACAGHARRVQTTRSGEEENPSQLLNEFVTNLLAFTTPLQPRTMRSSTPLMQMDPSAYAQSRDQMVSAPRQVITPRGKSVSKSDVVLVQGNSLKTWAYQVSPDRVQVVLSTDGRPLEADIQLWEGPDNTPTKMRVYSEDGSVRPFSAVIETPDQSASTVAIRNVGQVEFPLAAYVVANEVDQPISDFRETSTIVQGGALKTFDFDPSVDSVEIMIRTDGRPLNARLELLQGPNNQKTVVELYGEDGLERPFFAIIDTPGSGNVVRVVNTAPMEFPMFASIQPHSINEQMSITDPIIGDR